MQAAGSQALHPEPTLVAHFAVCRPCMWVQLRLPVPLMGFVSHSRKHCLKKKRTFARLSLLKFLCCFLLEDLWFQVSHLGLCRFGLVLDKGEGRPSFKSCTDSASASRPDCEEAALPCGARAVACGWLCSASVRQSQTVVITAACMKF